jgi:hypothetical protein
MGIYNNGTIFGIRIYNFNEDEFSNILFEEKYDEIMSHEQMREAYLFYAILHLCTFKTPTKWAVMTEQCDADCAFKIRNSVYDKKDIHFKIYTESISTYDSNNKEKIMMWYPLSLDNFLEKFGDGMKY